MLNHNICEDKFHGKWADIARQVHSTNGLPCTAPILQEYEKHVQRKNVPGEHLPATVAQIAAFTKECERSFYSQEGIKRINLRLSKTAGSWADSNPGYLAVNDCFTLTLDKCEASTDGRHFPRLAPVEMRNFIQLIEHNFPSQKAVVL
jgi:hypothetical protein